IGEVALPALLDVELGLLELVADKFQRRGAGKVGNRENRLEDSLQTFVRAATLGLLDHQELVVGSLLHLDEVGHLRNFGDLSEEFPDPSAAIERLGLSHCRSSSRLPAGLVPAAFLRISAKPKTEEPVSGKPARPSGKGSARAGAFWSAGRTPESV